jgi:Predicted transmembrane transcriptional regulator (anti-sigma factor)
MSDPETLPAGVHPEVELLPWYANDTLRQDDRQRVARHLESCPDCRRELDELTDIRRSLNTLYDAEPEPSARLARSVMAQVAEDSGRLSVQPHDRSRTFGFDGWFRSLLMPQWIPTLAAILLVFQMGLLVWLALPPLERGEVSTRSLGMQAATIRVLFHPSATEAQIRSLLQNLHARFVDGPNTEGMFTIAVTSDDPPASAILTQLRGRRDIVRSAELVRP